MPLDEALTRAAVDLSGRPYLVHGGEPAGFELHRIGGHFTGSMVPHVFEAIVLNAPLTVHVQVLAGRAIHSAESIVPTCNSTCRRSSPSRTGSLPSIPTPRRSSRPCAPVA